MDDRPSLTAIILAGGLGTRLRPVLDDQPKVLATVSGHPFLKYLLDQLASWQIQEVVLCTGYLGEQIELRFGLDYRGLRLIYSRELTPLGTAGALRLALPLINSDTVLVLNGDSYCPVDFDAFWRWHCLRKSAATLLLVNTHDTQRFGRVQVTADGQIMSFNEKKEAAEAGLINAGVYLIETDILKSIPESGSVSLEREIFPGWIGLDFYGYQTAGPFLDIGTPESYSSAEVFFVTAIASS
ncbi:MAG: nucleotidyltransferase family protein [Syntrophales bacterium]